MQDRLHLGGVGVALAPERARFVVRVPGSSRILLARPEQRVLRVSSPGFGDGGAADVEALLAAARAGLAPGAPLATAAEREAATRR
ncbi:hypothetical protein [Microbacterium sp. gxy059]|uniref:hypothetical protein n=1 Tax=Microbacterium sp. gxy059 TaxID=2957199 RepID=UPI003D995904